MNKRPAFSIRFSIVAFVSMCCPLAMAGDITNSLRDEAIGFAPGSRASGNDVVEVSSYINSSGLRTRIERVLPNARIRAEIDKARFIGTVNGWRIHSNFRAEELIIWQTRSLTTGRLTPRSVQAIGPRTVVRSSFRAPDARLSVPLIPRWLPSLRNPWAQRSVKSDWAIVTILGWLPGTVDGARRLMVDAARRQSLSLDRSKTNSAPPAPLMGGELLFFSGPGQQLMMTLTPEDAQVGVVAYYRYHRRIPDETIR